MIEPLSSLVDRGFRAAAGLATVIGPPLITRALSKARAHALELTLAEHGPLAQALAEDLHRPKTRARAKRTLEELGDRALADMRARVAREGSRLWHRPMATLDRVYASPSATEHIDDPDMPEDVRRLIMSSLHHTNRLLGFYDRVLGVFMPYLDLTPGRTTRVLDLAAGHGGFVIELARLAREKQLSLDLTASDLQEDYLRLGESEARSQGLDVRFVVQDALDLSNLEHPRGPEDEYDIITCTQSLHHFSPGQVAVMFEAAARVARRAVIFLDLCRSALAAAGATAYFVTRFGSRASAHDALISLRRAFVPEEMTLLARLGPWGEQAEASFMPPSHCVLTKAPLVSRPTGL